MGNVELPNREANFRALKVHSTLRRATCPLTRRSRHAAKNECSRAWVCCARRSRGEEGDRIPLSTVRVGLR